eukprot:6500-Pelagococcus_subviridis.AAC.2
MHHRAVRPLRGLAVVAHVRDEVVRAVHGLTAPRDRVRPRRDRDVVAESQALHGKRHDGGVLLHEKVVLREALVVHDEVPRQPRYLVRLHPRGRAQDLVRRLPVELSQDLRQRHLRDEVVLHRVLEQRRRRQVQRERVKRHLRALASLARSPHGRHLELALEAVVDHGAAALHLTAEVAVQRVEKPRHEVDRVGLLVHEKPPPRRRQHRLHELVRRHLTFEVPRVPNLPRELAEALNEQALVVARRRRRAAAAAAAFVPPPRGPQEEIPHRLDAHERLQHDVDVIRRLQIVQPDRAGEVVRPVQAAAPHLLRLRLLDLRGRERRIEDVPDVV